MKKLFAIRKLDDNEVFGVFKTNEKMDIYEFEIICYKSMEIVYSFLIDEELIANQDMIDKLFINTLKDCYNIVMLKGDLDINSLDCYSIVF